MKTIRSFFLLISIPSLLFSACQKDKAEKVEPVPVVDSVACGSDALVLSLTPTVESLPLYYAEKTGIFDTLGLKVSLRTYASQFDCDTAMLGTTAIGGSSDLVRLHYYAAQGDRLTAVTGLDGRWALLSSGVLRIKKTASLKDRMVAVARFSSSDIYSKEAVEAAKLEYADVFRPQVNDHRLRAAMLNNNQIDAAILPEPFLTQAKLAGHPVLYQIPEKSGRMGCLVFQSSVLKDKKTAGQVRLILKAYNQAVAEINQKGGEVCHDIFKNDYQIPKEVMAKLKLPKYRKAELPTDAEIKKAQDFLKLQGRWKKSETPSYLFNGDLLPK